MRGGVTVGRIVKSHQLLFGPGVIQAYELEKRIQWPVIAIDKSVIDELGTNPGLDYFQSGDEEQAVRSCLRRDKHTGLEFLDYLSVAHGEMAADEFKQFLQAHSDMIVGRLRQHQGNYKVQIKYEWLKSYHEMSCRTLPLSREARPNRSEIIPL